MYGTDYMDRITGHPCANCEDEEQAPGSLFCSRECKAEYEGEDEES